METERGSLSKLQELKAKEREILMKERIRLEEIKEKQANLKMEVMSKKQNKALVEGSGGMDLGRLKKKEEGMKENVEETKGCRMKIRGNAAELFQTVARANEDLLAKTEDATRALTNFSDAEMKFKDVKHMMPKREELAKEFEELSVTEDDLAASDLRNNEEDGSFVLDIELENAKVFRGEVEIPMRKSFFY